MGLSRLSGLLDGLPLLLCLFLGAFPLAASLSFPPSQPVPPVLIWPQPALFDYGSPASYFFLDPKTFQFQPQGTYPTLVQNAVKRCKKLIFGSYTSSSSLSSSSWASSASPFFDPSSSAIPLHSLSLEIKGNANEANRLGIDESYSLLLSDKEAKLVSNTSIGLLRGLESFAQLVQYSQPSSQGGNPAFRIPVEWLRVEDRPRFPWRGFMLDTSRHFLSVASLLKLLDTLSWHKFNLLHWHFVDDESWSVESVRFPLFSAKGAYSAAQTYSSADVKQVLQYAQDRGILVLPEFDMPAHSSAWGWGYPQTTLQCPSASEAACAAPSAQPPCQPLLDPTGAAFPFVQGLLSEFDFGAGFVHLGGDEVASFCAWNSSQKVRDFMERKGLRSAWQLRDDFQTQVQTLSKAQGLTPVFWEEVFNGNFSLLPEAVIHVWFGPQTTEKVVKKGHRAVQSFGFYLDQQRPANEDRYLWGDTFLSFYENEPVPANLTAAEAALVLGGEAALWAEQIDDWSWETRAFPRAAAISEALWTPPEAKDSNKALARIDRHSCLLRQRGIRAHPIRAERLFGACELPPYSPLAQQLLPAVFSSLE